MGDLAGGENDVVSLGQNNLMCDGKETVDLLGGWNGIVTIL